MRLVHTADLHLGRLFHGVHLTDDQANVLDQLVDLVADVRPQAVLIAGDVYDRALPPAEAVALLDDVLARLVLGLGTPVLMVAGNHDSPTRLGFGAPLLAARGLHVAGPLAAIPRRIDLRDAHGEVAVHLLPFSEPAVARAAYNDERLHDQAAAVSAGVERARAHGAPGGRAVLLTHAFVAGGLTSESERPLTVGGTGAVPAQVFAGFDLVAAGHLHRAQSVAVEAGRRPPRVHYCGSPLKYSFAEAAQTKTVSVVEIGPPGTAADGLATVTVEAVPLRPRRDVRRISGTLEEILAAARDDGARDDYIEAELQDHGALFDAMGRLRTAYPNALSVVLPQITAAAHHRRVCPDPKRATDPELLTAFIEHVTGEHPTADELATFAELADGLRRREREATT